MTADNKQAWRHFYSLEKRFWGYLNEHAECLYSADGEDLMYRCYHTKAGVELEKPPRFVHRIIRLNSSSDEVVSLNQTLKDTYQQAVGSAFKRYPDRFPVFYQSVAQINISINPAFDSRQLDIDSECSLIVKMPGKQDFKQVVNQMESQVSLLQSAGFRSARLVNENGTLLLNVEAGDIYTFSQASLIQMRRRTGYQYRARLRHSHESTGYRVKLGLIVLDHQSEVQICESNPQAVRPHGYSARGVKIILPLETDVELYHKLI